MFIIAEAGVNHNGDVAIAKKLVDMAARCGADAVKFQTFKASDVVAAAEAKVAYQQANDATVETQFEMLNRLELTYDEFRELKCYCDEVGIMFLSTPFSVGALDFLVSIGMEIVKLSSTEVTNAPFLAAAAKSKKPIILSTGMSFFEEVVDAVNILEEAGAAEITLLHCTTNYPTAIAEANIRAMVKLKEVAATVGYSDHTDDAICAVVATALGAQVIEKHITLDKNMVGPDHKASATEVEFAEYVYQIRAAEVALGDGIKTPTAAEDLMRSKVRRSIVAKIDIAAGAIIDASMLDFRRPAAGISPMACKKILGKAAATNIKKDAIIMPEDIAGSLML
ncbi:N-acetylneuraminate synthase [Candidatus Epulonipiscium viviparus]|uniref:N-acetylneuraminate synthase n=1 Tax=Candidatus Epulonipiscium viviparus TaxID=420336 RepID=UPI000495EEB4|nr:N-acetylneuraminate synthase [Candidatus Epulopiscium viviparus]